RVNAGRIAVGPPLLGALLEHEHVGGERNRLADDFGADAFGERGGGGFGRALGRTLVDRAGELFDGGIAGIARAELRRGELVLIEQLGHQRPDRRLGALAADAVLLVIAAEADALPQDRVGVV